MGGRAAHGIKRGGSNEIGRPQKPLAFLVNGFFTSAITGGMAAMVDEQLTRKSERFLEAASLPIDVGVKELNLCGKVD